MSDTKPLSMLDCLGQEFMVGDICLLTYYDHGDSTLEPILIVKIDEDTDSYLKPTNVGTTAAVSDNITSYSNIMRKVVPNNTTTMNEVLYQQI